MPPIPFQPDPGFLPGPAASARAPRPARRAAFTLIEILVVVGIIMLLITIAVVGFNQLGRTMSTKATKGTFQNLQGMVDEFAAINGTGLIESYWITGDTAPAPVYIDPSTTVPLSIPTPADVTDTTTTSSRFNGLAMQSTQAVMRILLRIPNNNAAILQMPTKQLLVGPSAAPSGTNPITVDAQFRPLPAMIVDGWRNPIIYVPAGGLSGVAQGFKADGITVNFVTITSPDGRPFWASAGPDGDFSNTNSADKRDDNIYSFQN